MSESLCKLIQKYEDRKYYGLCVLSLFLLTWLVIAFTGFAEILSLFSNKHLGLIEAFLFTQIDLLSFQRSGIEILPNDSWHSVANDTFLDSFRYWYNAVYITLWIILVRLLISKNLNTLILNIEISDAKNDAYQLSSNLRAVILKAYKTVKTNARKRFDESPKTKQETRKKAIERENWTSRKTSMVKVDSNNIEKSIETVCDGLAPEYKECPFCCEQILYRAVKCKHCGSELEPMSETNHQKVINTTSNDEGSEVTWKHYAGIGVVVVFILSALANGNSKKTPDVKRSAAEELCKTYIGKMFNRPKYIIKTKHIKYDGGHFVKASYNRPQDGDYFEYVCHLDNGSITYAGIFNGSDLGRWRYEDEMNYKKSKSGSWVLY